MILNDDKKEVVDRYAHKKACNIGTTMPRYPVISGITVYIHLGILLCVVFEYSNIEIIFTRGLLNIYVICIWMPIGSVIIYSTPCILYEKRIESYGNTSRESGYIYFLEKIYISAPATTSRSGLLP